MAIFHSYVKLPEGTKQYLARCLPHDPHVPSPDWGTTPPGHSQAMDTRPWVKVVDSETKYGKAMSRDTREPSEL